MANIKKNDIVKILAGRDNGKTGKVLTVFPKKMKALVQGINMVKKHSRRQASDQQQGGIVHKESSINVSNLMIICQKCSRATRVGFNKLSDGTKVRICKKCKEII
ncbi:MAG: 50S ribosomal protein L24 [Omnitrophica bacterium GWA2_41_15]|nr:MAG: 50S ribosomal protein L24 [Omnitrophica bacterium GWA2_41_15]HAZ10910.1 50S ribosomal protein L24 [Candidatus Omnitrophota bacterium]